MRMLLGDCVEQMATLPDASIDAVCTDPPYGIRFMGKAWDGPDIEYEVQRRADLADRYAAEGRAFGGRAKPPGGTLANPAGLAGIYDVSAKGNRAFQQWTEAWAAEAFRVLKPGGHLLSFASTRTYHRMASGVEDAGFEIRDTLAWMFGSGFPKSLDVSKAVDKRRDWTALPKMQAAIKAARARLGISQSEAARRVGMIEPGESLGGGGFMWFETGMRVPTREQWPLLKLHLGLDDECDAAFEAAEREVLGEYADDQTPGGFGEHRFVVVDREITAPLSEEGQRWQGWGTALKPAFEPIVLARKPLAGTVAVNVLAHGTGAINVDGCRIEFADAADEAESKDKNRHADFGTEQGGNAVYGDYSMLEPRENYDAPGRWPANVLLDEEAAAALDASTGDVSVGHWPSARPAGNLWEGHTGQQALAERHADAGGPSRFFYCAKVSRAEREAGLDGFGVKVGKRTQEGGDDTRGRPLPMNRNVHPTVKPIALMRWLIRLVTPPGGTVLDPFLGSGSTGCAAALEGMAFVGIERETDYMEIARARIQFWEEHGDEALEIVRVREAGERVRAELADAGQLDLFG